MCPPSVVLDQNIIIIGMLLFFYVVPAQKKVHVKFLLKSSTHTYFFEACSSAALTLFSFWMLVLLCARKLDVLCVKKGGCRPRGNRWPAHHGSLVDGAGRHISQMGVQLSSNFNIIRQRRRRRLFLLLLLLLLLFLPLCGWNGRRSVELATVYSAWARNTGEHFYY